ncbi:MAG: hypothetical protein IAF38_07370 [Bacteroidia bacterium]|nr:hypothetical protein [Bacteroidia bacterium]
MRYFLIYVMIFCATWVLPQKIELGVRAFKTLTRLSIQDSPDFYALGYDSTFQVQTDVEKTKGWFSPYVKFYPDNNNLFFSFDLGHAKTRIASSFNPDPYGFYKREITMQVGKFNSRLMGGYDFSKQKEFTFYGLGGLKHSFVYKSIRAYSGVAEGKPDDFDAFVNSRFSGIKKNQVALCLGGGVRMRRFSVDLITTLDPFTKNKGALRKTFLTAELGLNYVFYNRNLTKNQYTEKKLPDYKLVKSSDPLITFSVFSEKMIFSRFSSFLFADTFLFTPYSDTVPAEPNGYMVIDVTKVPKTHCYLSLGLSAKARLAKSFYFRNSISYNIVELIYSEFGKGTVTALSNNFVEQTVIDGSEYKMRTRLDHASFNFALGYGKLTFRSFFAEAGFEINYWKVKRNFIEKAADTGPTYFISYENYGIVKYYNFRDRISWNKFVYGVNATVGYKAGNILIYFNFGQTLQNNVTASLYGSVGKFTYGKIGLAYQFKKIYSKATQL